MDIKPLEKLGLHASEIKVYLAILKKDTITATEISQETKLNRSHVYDKIGVLLEKGFVSYIIKNNVKYFRASNPEKILDYVKEVEKDMKKVVSELNKIKKTSKEETIVELYYGREGMKTVFKDVLREKKDYYVFGEEGKFQEVLPIFIEQFLRDVKRFNMKEYLLSKESKRGKIKTTPKNTKIKYLPDKYFSPVMTAIYGEKIAIFVWGEPLFTILIKDKRIYGAFKTYFDLLWKIAKR